MKKRLILHIGMHKTGSTSIQRFFSRNRRVLRLTGLCYPESVGPDGRRQPKHNAIFTAISHEADFGASHPVLGPSDRVIERTAAEIERAPGRVGVISAEGLSGERPVFAEALAPLADRFETTVVMFVRRQDLWAESFYKQMVMSREVRCADDFATFLARPETRAHLDYAAIAGWWDARFPGRLSVHPFEPAIDETSPLSAFLTLAGLPKRLLWLPHARAVENRSPDLAEVEAVRERNAMGRELARAANRVGRPGPGYLDAEERIQLMSEYDRGNTSLVGYVHSSKRERLFLQSIFHAS